MKIGNTISNVQIPARPSNAGNGEASALDKAMGALEIGAGLEFVVSGKDKQGNEKAPELKNQYSRVASSKWAPLGKTFKVFEAADQSDLGQFEARYVIARVDFVVPTVRKVKAKAAAPVVQEAAQETEAEKEAREFAELEAATA